MNLPLRIAGLAVEAGGRRVLDGIDLEIVSRGITAIIGPNGAGKSTLLRALDGLVAPSAGCIAHGRDGAGPPPRRAFVFQRAALLPEVLFLDEPTASLDPAATEEIERLVAALRDAGTKILLVSHNLGQVARLAEDVVVLAAGRVAEHGPVDNVFRRPATQAARAYLKGELPWQSFDAFS